MPVLVTDAIPAFVQYGVPAYDMVAEGAAVIVRDAVVVNTAHPPLAPIV